MQYIKSTRQVSHVLNATTRVHKHKLISSAKYVCVPTTYMLFVFTHGINEGDVIQDRICTI